MNAQHATAQAHPNIALAKYWGKRAGVHNIPAVPSLSMTLSGMATVTHVAFESQLTEDTLILNGKRAEGTPLTRVSGLLDRVRARSGEGRRARVESQNDFPTASGLASSASAFAALAVAASAAAGLPLIEHELSDLARKTSVSSARSVLGGFVALVPEPGSTDSLPATLIAAPQHWDLELVVAVTDEGEKKVGSTEGMAHTVKTSPYFGAFVDRAPSLFARIREAILARDFSALVPAAEQSALMMHASAMAADPAVVYFAPATLAAYATTRQLRQDGVPALATMDAGPHVKVVTTAKHANDVELALQKTPGVLRTIRTRPGEGARIVSL